MTETNLSESGFTGRYATAQFAVNSEAYTFRDFF